MKTCRICDEVRPLERFHKNCRTVDGLDPRCKDCRRRYYSANRDRLKKAALDYYYANPEPRKAYVREYRKTYDVGEVRQRRLARGRERYRENLGYERERSKRYYEANKDRWRVYEAARRRADTPEVRERMLTLVGEPCAYCGSTDRIEIDHIVPLARGGKHVPENLAPACRPCNRSKGAKLVSEWQGVAA